MSPPGRPRGTDGPEALGAKGRSPSPLVRFVCITLAWLPIAFAVWYVLAPIVLLPAEAIVRVLVYGFFRGLVTSVESHGGVLSFVTTLRPGETRAGGVLTV